MTDGPYRVSGAVPEAPLEERDRLLRAIRAMGLANARGMTNQQLAMHQAQTERMWARIREIDARMMELRWGR